MSESIQPTVNVDGFDWIQRAGDLWGSYDVCAAYVGCSRKSFSNYVFRHEIRTITHGPIKIVNKTDLDRKSGARLNTEPQVA